MRRKQGWRSLITLVVLLGMLLFVWVQRQAIYDWTKLRNYQAPPAIAQLATDTAMNNHARHVFYVQHPELNDKPTFNDHCSGDEVTIVLGCYIAHQGIYVLKVDDARLGGIEEVTAAHELLHAAYDRLSSKEKKRVNALLNQAYADVASPRIRDTIERYKQAGADITNELHSILGTEVRNLPAALETYYAKYFTDRIKVVAYSEQYEQAFTDRKVKVAAFDAQLTVLKAQIEANETDLNQQGLDLGARRTQMDAALAAQQYETYNAGVPGYNAAVRNYNVKVEQTRSLIDQYNQMLDERNALALEEQELFQAIDSRPTTVQSK